MTHQFSIEFGDEIINIVGVEEEDNRTHYHWVLADVCDLLDLNAHVMEKSFDPDDKTTVMINRDYDGGTREVQELAIDTYPLLMKLSRNDEYLVSPFAKWMVTEAIPSMERIICINRLCGSDAVLENARRQQRAARNRKKKLAKRRKRAILLKEGV